jgi:dienelactone hydrolase
MRAGLPKNEAGLKEHPLLLPAGKVQLDATLSVPAKARGLVCFAHGSGSGRRSTRNHPVAAALNRAGLATLLLDLLTAEEQEQDEKEASLRFNVPLLAGRLVAVSRWAAGHRLLGRLPQAYFGASTGAAAALLAAAQLPDQVLAVVSRGGRPDLAGHTLARVKAAVLLLVGSRDPQVLILNQIALDDLHGEKKLSIIPGASHLFEEPGTLEEVSWQAREWILDHLKSPVPT